MRTKADWLIAAGIVLGVFAVFGQSMGFDIVDWDDPYYLSWVQEKRLRIEDLRWAFTTFAFFNWHPLTWLSFLLDFELFGHSHAALHRTNVALHALTAALLFWVLRRTTGSLWRSALVAGLFAWHPLRAESVAWISQRKDVLSGVFFVSTLAVYVTYAARPTLLRYLATVGCGLLAFMAKPTTVMLPFVLLLFDVWPLRRWQALRPSPAGREEDEAPHFTSAPLGRLLLEKAPLLLAALAVSRLTLRAQELALVDRYPLPNRLANATLSYVRYLKKALWPTDLTAFYPWGPLGLDALALSILLLGGATVLALRVIRTQPWWTVGWLWFLAVLVPMLGLVQVGNQAMADRYTYLALMGPTIAVGFGVPPLLRSRGVPRSVIASGAAAVLLLLSILCYRQVSSWRTTRTLFTHALEVNERNPQAHTVLGEVMRNAHEYPPAEAHLRRALELTPNNWQAAINLGFVLLATGRVEEGESLLARVLVHTPKDAETHQAIGLAYLRQGRFAEARDAFARAAEIDPGSPRVREQLALAERGLVESTRGAAPLLAPAPLPSR